MQRIVDGILFEGKFVDDVWEVRTWESNGVMERSARQCVAWQEIGPVPPLDDFDPVKDAEYLEEKRQQALKKSAQRAKQMCRRIIISEGFDELLTLTYRENQEDRDECKRHFKLWVQRMKRALGDFRYCASFERQERGAMHVHVATHKLPKHVNFKGVKIKAWQLGTACWRGIVGKDNGMCFVGGRRSADGRRHKAMTSLARMAQYVSKYIMKDYEESPSESNRYSHSNGAPVPKSHVMRLKCSLRELIELTFEQGEGDVIVSHRLGHFKDSIWFVVEKRPPDGALIH